MIAPDPQLPIPDPADLSMIETLVRNPASATLLGIAALAFAWKVLWPLLSTFVQNQTTSGRTESGTLEQLSRELAKAIQRAEDERQIRIAVEKEREEFFGKLVRLEAKLEVALADIESRKKENVSLRYQLDQCREHHSSAPKPSNPCPDCEDEVHNA